MYFPAHFSAPCSVCGLLCDCGVFPKEKRLLVRTMAQRLAPASVPQTHAEQAEQDEKDSAQLFFNSLGRLADGDADLSNEEANTLQRWGTQGT